MGDLSLDMHPTTAVDRFLQVQELMSMVCEILADDAERGALYSLARTHWCIHHAAIQCLWRDIPGLSALIGLFPEGCFRPSKQTDALLTIARPEYIEIGMERVRRYAPFVKAIGYDPEDGDIKRALAWTALHALAEYKSTTLPLFPNVERVTIPLLVHHPAITVFYTPLVLAPSVRSITILAQVFLEHGVDTFPDVAECMITSEALADRLVEASGSLTELRIEATPGSWYLHVHLPIRGLNSLLTRMPAISTLRTLDITHLDIESGTLEKLSELQGLEHLSLLLSESSELYEDPSTQWTFPALLEITLSSTAHDHLEACESFLKKFCAPRLTSFTLRQRFHGHDVTFDDTVFTPLSHCTNPNNITSIVIKELGVYYRVDPEDEPFNERAFNLDLESLSAFNNLRNLEISPFTAAELEDSALTNALSNWQQLERLVLKYDIPSETTDSNLTLEGVHAAVQLCPNLSHLTLPCLAEKVPTTVPTPHPSLVYWNVCTSTISSGRNVAAWLQKAFPSLRHVDSFESVHKYMMTWNRGGEVDCGEWAQSAQIFVMVSLWNEVAAILRN